MSEALKYVGEGILLLIGVIILIILVGAVVVAIKATINNLRK